MSAHHRVKSPLTISEMRKYRECRALWSVAKANVDVGALD